MNATSLRSLLGVVVVLLIIAVGGGFYFAYQQLHAYAVEVSHSVVDADASGEQIAELQTLKQDLANSESLVSKANKIFATRENYQSQAISDVQKYAQTYGVTITNTSFETVAEGSNEHTFVITLQSPVSYTKLIQLLDAIEGNLPKMQVTSVTLGNSIATNPGDVTTENIKIGISTR